MFLSCFPMIRGFGDPFRRAGERLHQASDSKAWAEGGVLMMLGYHIVGICV